MQRPARAEGRGRSLLGRRAPRRGRAAEAHGWADRRPRGRAEGQGRGDPGGLMAVGDARGADGRCAGSAGASALRRDHHRRKRPLGAIPGAGGQRGHEAGADTVKARLRDAAELGMRGAHGLLVLDRELVAAESGGRRADADVRIADRRRNPRAAPRRCADALHRPPRGRLAAALGAMDWRGTDDRRERRGSRCTSRSTTAGAQRSSTRPARFEGGGEEALRALLYAPEMHDPDLIIRTSGERRLSNFLLWQSAYSELVFRDELWPDFTRASLEECLDEYAARRRRFGGR